jgi:thiol-disulfide isomerase/thioredoxin
MAAIFERVAKRATPTPLANSPLTAESPPARESPAVPLGRGPGPFPDLELARAGGGSVRLSELQGNVILMIVWATWNGPSGKELPIIQKLYDLYRDRNFVVISLNVDTDRNLVAPFVKKFDVSFPVYFPSPAEAGTLTAGGLPVTLILGPDRTLLDRTVGFYPEWEGRWKQVVEKHVKP